MITEVLIDGKVVEETQLFDILCAKAMLEKVIKGRMERELAELDRRKNEILSFLETGQPEMEQEIKNKIPSAPKYRDPATGKTWSGKGKRPGWFDSDRAADFLIEAHPADFLADA